MFMKNLWLSLLSLLGLAYWVEITTEAPHCTYYFGPFMNYREANEYHDGYVEDLKAEDAQDIQVSIKQCKPQELTLFDESEPYRIPGKQLASLAG